MPSGPPKHYVPSPVQQTKATMRMRRKNEEEKEEVEEEEEEEGGAMTQSTQKGTREEREGRLAYGVVPVREFRLFVFILDPWRSRNCCAITTTRRFLRWGTPHILLRVCVV